MQVVRVLTHIHQVFMRRDSSHLLLAALAGLFFLSSSSLLKAESTKRQVIVPLKVGQDFSTVLFCTGRTPLPRQIWTNLFDDTSAESPVALRLRSKGAARVQLIGEDKFRLMAHLSSTSRRLARLSGEPRTGFFDVRARRQVRCSSVVLRSQSVSALKVDARVSSGTSLRRLRRSIAAKGADSVVIPDSATLSSVSKGTGRRFPLDVTRCAYSDHDADGTIGFGDLILGLMAWGADELLHDANQDGQVNAADIEQMLQCWSARREAALTPAPRPDEPLPTPQVTPEPSPPVFLSSTVTPPQTQPGLVTPTATLGVTPTVAASTPLPQLTNTPTRTATPTATRTPTRTSSATPTRTPTVASTQPSGGYCSQITQYGITWNFDRSYPCGNFVNGDSWVVGPLSVVSVSPGWDGTTNGSMLDPNPDASQGYDTRAYSYSSQKRVTFPKVISGDASLISTVGLSACATGGAAHCLSTAAVLTILNAAPAPNSFRPPYVAGTKRIRNKSSVRYELLPKLQKPTGVPLPIETSTMTRVWLDHGPKVAGATIHPSANMPPYPRDSSMQVSRMALLVLIDQPQQREYADRMIQLGIDLYPIALANGDAFRAYGGFGSGRKWPILFAGILLNDQDMLSPPEFIAQNSSINKFGEDGHTYYGQPTASYPGGKPLWGQDCGSLESPYFTNHDCRDPNGQVDSEYMVNGGSYRTCCTSRTWLGSALAARIMGAVNQWDHPAFFDYVDRWVAEPETWSNSTTNFYRDIYGYGGDGGGFMTAMWATYR